MRQILNAIRAFPELILAIAIFIPIAGLGPVAGALAIGIHSAGTLGKLTAEAIEGIDEVFVRGDQPQPIQVANAVMSEAALSFLGLGMPVTKPSLGSLIRAGQEFFFSGSWWITVFPGLWLVVFVLVINLLGDWLRDVLNPKLYKG